MSIFRTYQINGRPVTEAEYGRYVSELLRGCGRRAIPCPVWNRRSLT